MSCSTTRAKATNADRPCRDPRRKRDRRPTVFYEDGRLPLAVSLVIDRSSSMSGLKFRSAVAAAAAFIDRFGPHDVFEGLTFNEHVERLVRFGEASGDVPAIASRITADGQTALYDAVLVALNDLTSNRRAYRGDHRDAIIVLSDGIDNTSVSGLEDPADEAAWRAIPIYAVSLRVDDKEGPQPPPYTLT